MMSNDIIKLTGQAKQDFQTWSRLELERKRLALGHTNRQYNVLKKRGEAIFDEIIKRQGEITKIKADMSWHAEWIAELQLQINAIEAATGMICEPTKTQQVLMELPTQEGE